VEGFEQEALVEEYINGREFTVSVLGNENPRILPIVEQRFDSLPKGMNKIAGFELKWVYEDSLENLEDAYYCPPVLSKKVEEQINEMTLKVYKSLNVRECARLDFRLDENENLYFIEINTLPGINPDPKIVSYFPTSVRKAGMSYKDLIKTILDLASKRYNLA
jgi:D-alanine-D-alanine ligase